MRASSSCSFDKLGRLRWLDILVAPSWDKSRMILENMELIQRVHLNKSCAVVALGSTRNARSGEVQCGVR